MKIEYLEIKHYKQFIDLKLNLTYPKGHKKAGKPLDKICIIGQSGTGKTNLLNIIKKSTIDFSAQETNSYLPFKKFIQNKNAYIETKFKTAKEVTAKTLFTKNESKIEFDSDVKFNENEKIYFCDLNKCPEERKFEIIKELNEDEMTEEDKELYNELLEERAILSKKAIQLIKNKKINDFKYLGTSFAMQNYFDVLTGKKDLTLADINQIKNEINLGLKSLEKKYKKTSKSIKEIKNKNFTDAYIIDINSQTKNLWIVLQEKIKSYEKIKTEYIKELSNKLLNDEEYDKKDYKKDLENWEKENENILDKIADDLNFILKKFNLELTKIDENQTSYDAIIIKDLSNNSLLDYEDLSSGTKNLISTFIPLKIYNPRNSIILIDEPENSFYPDIQRQLIELYTQVGKDNQLIVATHSPLIASSFEPWEVVELKFDKDNQIYREKYYNGENHIDNYFIDPRMLTWTSILTDIFDLQEDSNFTFREKKLMEYATLKAEIKNISNKNEKEKKFKELQKISKILGLDN